MMKIMNSMLMKPEANHFKGFEILRITFTELSLIRSLYRYMCIKTKVVYEIRIKSTQIKKGAINKMKQYIASSTFADLLFCPSHLSFSSDRLFGVPSNSRIQG